jgi:2-(1,2-epoxy-1,2-dihydrophenyl)acetyl-CoA isomerase
VHRVVPDAALEDEVRRLTAEAARRAVDAFGRVKRLMNRAFDSSLERQLEDERHELAAAADGAEGREGLAAFVEKRPPDFRAASGGA